ncbi:helix-turn-helix domain-containing protein [Aureispira anguillae]|uniref:Helix-turn-helix domain-containing protein n=1 Tax=Aureispira anguillae TaxID=2864201 RepID=A0A915YGY9_9BACT|nr:helix-turn-helix transcriptional regulator [Aureispira anguillae]BDS12973.1 helix-turn-helix domain-containing protein [Aureispira anguillae]
MSISERFKLILFLEEKNVKQLASEINVTQSALNKVVRGEAMPSSKILIPLAQRGINVNWLLIGKGDTKQESKENRNLSLNKDTLRKRLTPEELELIVKKLPKNQEVIFHTETSAIEKLEAQNKALEKELETSYKMNKILAEAKKVLENQIKDKDRIISLLEKK